MSSGREAASVKEIPTADGNVGAAGSNDVLYAQVCPLDLPYRAARLFDYKIPRELCGAVQRGDFVTVPFGRGNRPGTALVTGVSDSPSAQRKGAKPQYKEICELLGAELRLSEEQLGLVSFMQERLFCSPGEAVYAIIPAFMLGKADRKYTLTEAGRRLAGGDGEGIEAGSVPSDAESDATEQSSAKLSGAERRALELLYSAKSRPGGVRVSAIREQSVRRALALLEKRGYVSSSVAVKRIGKSFVEMVRLSVTPERARAAAQELSGRARVMAALLERLAGESDGIRVDWLCSELGCDRSAVSRLVTKGLAVIDRTESYRMPTGGRQFTDAGAQVGATAPPDPALGELSPAQERAYSMLERQYSLSQACASLLYGVTGSGKTRVIKAMIDRVLSDGRQVIVLVPEISLTPQTVSYFSGVYGDRTAVIHSMLSHGERYDAYRRIRRGEVQVCIGTRSAVFAPFSDIGLIVIDEEQEHTYKSDSAPRYHARDIAAYRCGKHRAMLLLASATPSVESFYKASTGTYQLVRLDERYSGAPMPEVTVAGVAADLRSGVLIGRELDGRIRQALADRRQVILFMNRRGYNHFMICPSCREAVHCPNCSVSMTYHTARERDVLICHFCGHRQPIPEKCPSCGVGHLTRIGFGIQRVEEELRTRYPQARILRMDADTTSAKNSFYEMLDRFRGGEYDILLGTQMVTKGHDFPAVDVSGVILADTALYLEDFRASERAFSMMTQLVGRAGRAGQRGEAVIQTCNPEHPVISCAARQDYDAFYKNEIAYRRAMLFPPFCHIALISVTGEDEVSVMSSSTRLYAYLTELIDGEFRDVAMICFGPFEAAVYRVNKMYRYRIVCKIRQDGRTRELLRRLLLASGEKEYGGCSVSIDIDPDTV